MKLEFSRQIFDKILITIIIIFYGLGRLTCSGIDALPSFPGASTNKILKYQIPQKSA